MVLRHAFVEHVTVAGFYCYHELLVIDILNICFFCVLFQQLCSGMDENAVGTCAELIFAPIDASFADDAPLLPSGFRIIPLDSGKVRIIR